MYMYAYTHTKTWYDVCAHINYFSARLAEKER